MVEFIAGGWSPALLHFKLVIDMKYAQTLFAALCLFYFNDASSKPQDYPYPNGSDIPAMAYIEHGEVYNPEAVIPPQCYTKTDGDKNPCYACHQTYDYQDKRPNAMSDGELQGEYQFSDLGVKNHWKNLFVDRRALIKEISDNQIRAYVMEDNYTPWLEALKKDESWKGEIAELENLAFPEQAFDKLGVAKDNSHWIAYNYKPFPSTFWPTNGSTGDAMIRLGKAFRELDGEFSQDVYFANLALVELAIKDSDKTTLPPVSEQRIGVDLNGNGELEPQVHNIVKRSHYLGDASDIELARMLYPKDTEFLHTVRYIGVDEQGQIFNAPRMKEVRYMKKHVFKSRQNLASSYYIEAKDKNFEMYPRTIGQGDKGINNNFGWTINGYIEDEQGKLRQQHHQELAFCNGCHKTIGATFDQTFSFPRKVAGARGWGYIDLTAMTDVPNLNEQNSGKEGEPKGEFLTYFERVGGGDEFRQNQEMLSRWFKADGSVDAERVKKAANIYELITPSSERAMNLNKAYFTIVKEQSYLYGRDATIIEASNVLQQIDEDQPPLEKAHRHRWDMRLDWQPDSQKSSKQNVQTSAQTDAQQSTKQSTAGLDK